MILCPRVVRKWTHQQNLPPLFKEDLINHDPLVFGSLLKISNWTWNRFFSLGVPCDMGFGSLITGQPHFDLYPVQLCIYQISTTLRQVPAISVPYNVCILVSAPTYSCEGPSHYRYISPSIFPSNRSENK